jgi:long-chain acyl-CoA synthetase
VGGRLRYFVSGGVSLSPALSYAFLGAGRPHPAGLRHDRDLHRLGQPARRQPRRSVGQTLPRRRVQIAHDGEILVRGPNVMRGYYGQPRQTASVFTKDGWFRRATCGAWTGAATCYITDRKKELFKLSNGKYVAPQLLESLSSRASSSVRSSWSAPGARRRPRSSCPEWEALASALGREGAGAPRARGMSRDQAAVKLVQREVQKLTSTLNDTSASAASRSSPKNSPSTAAR